MKVKSESEVAQWCPTLSNRMDCSLPGSSVHGIFQARVLEWGAIAFSTTYLRLLIFLPAILIPVCASSSLAFHMMYSANKFNKQSENIQPWHTPFPIWNWSVVVLCPILTVASWPAYRFLKRQIRWSGIPISQNFPQFIVMRVRDTNSSCSWKSAYKTYNEPSIYIWLLHICEFNQAWIA